MKVLLVHPPPYKNIRCVRQGRCLASALPGIRMEFPVFLAYTASLLRENGHSVAVVDATAEEMPFDSVEKRIEDFAPDAVIVETVPSTYRGDMRIAEIAKQTNRGIYTIYYGWQTTARPADVMANQNINFAIRGEPEYTALELLNVLQHKGEIKDVKGLSFRKNNVVRHNRSRPLNEQLDKLPYPARDLFSLEKYVAMPLGQITTVIANKGCPYSCVYCAAHLMDGSYLRSRHPKNVADEIESVVNRFNIRNFFFYADTFTLWNDRNISQFCREILKRKLNIRWLVNSRVDTLPSENTLKWMAKSGCFLIQFGVESGSLRMIEAMRKGRNKRECERYLKAIKPAIEKTKKSGIFTNVNMIVGFLGEDQETLNESLNLVKECPPDHVYFPLLTVFPGTVLGKKAERRGLFPPDGKGFFFDAAVARHRCASILNIKPDSMIELQRFAMNATKLSVSKKLQLGMKMICYFLRRRDLDVFLNAAMLIIRNICAGRTRTMIRKLARARKSSPA